MSFILDALKKSEHERQRQTMPGLVESSIARPRQRLPLWAIALIVLLGINLVGLAVVLTRGLMTTPRAQAPTPPLTRPRSAPDDPDAAAYAGKPFSPLDTAPVYAPEIPVTASQGNNVAQGGNAAQSGNAASNFATTPELRALPGTGMHGVRRSDPVLNKDDYKADDDDVLPSIDELNLTGAQALPELHLDVHVFATKPAERFVFINMRKYHEGSTLQEGPTIERIRRDGVILNSNGLRFLLPRQ